MFPKITLIAAIAAVALGVAVPASADSWYLDRKQPTVRVSPDVADYAAAAEARRLNARLDAKEQAFLGRPESRSDVAQRLEPTVVTASGREIEWPQVAVGFGLGLALAFGLAVGLRLVHIRQPAH
jgi:hypothetical protein